MKYVELLHPWPLIALCAVMLLLSAYCCTRD